MKFDIITILPDFFDCFLKESLIKKAIDKKVIDIKVHNLRKWTKDKHKVIDDTPYGGGPGMVFKVEPIYRAVKDIKFKRKKTKVVFLSPRGKKFNQTIAKKWAKLDQIIFISGRYEGVDERVRKFSDEFISIGDFTTLGGEISSMAIIEAVVRFVPKVVGKRASVLKENYPQYTRPAVFEIDKKTKLKVPEVLISGDHKKIEKWRELHSVKVAKKLK